MSNLEIFYDESYYGMFCVRHVDDRSFNDTLHFNTRKEAEHAKYVNAVLTASCNAIEKWMEWGSQYDVAIKSLNNLLEIEE